MYEATCHCGNVKLKVETLPEKVTSCNCSICHRYGTLWGYYPASDVKVESNTPLVANQWGDKNLDFNHCSSCGCVTHWSVAGEAKEDSKVGLNTRLFPREQTASIKIRRLDGAVTWKFLDDDD